MAFFNSNCHFPLTLFTFASFSPEKEIDFIAKKGKELSYYQISYIMGDEKTREREFGVYKSVTDNFPKYVLSMDHFDFSQDGIIHKNIIDFLLEDEGIK